LADRLSAARRRGFVGRTSEKSLFESLLRTSELPFHLLYIFGPGGIGKTSLLAEFSESCNRAQVQAALLDARNIEPTPDAFLSTLQNAMGLETRDEVFGVLGSTPRLYVILIDTSEKLAPLDDWLREIFLPELSGNVFVVLAGRNPLSPAWRADAGWQAYLRVLALRNLSPPESQLYLARRQISADQHKAVLDFTHGHPLALSLVADVLSLRPNVRFSPEDAPDVIKTLLEQFVQQVPGPAHRAALEACAMAHLTTESLLGEMLNISDVHDLFEWLRGLSFIESGRMGLFPHDLAREALIADVRWRNPDWYAELHRRARAYYTKRLQQTRGEEQRRVLFEDIFLHRDNPVVRPFFEWQTSGGALTDTAQPTDIPVLVEMVKRHEGEASARIASYWFSRRLENVLVFRDAQQQVIGFVMMLALHSLTPGEREEDPAVKAAWTYLQRHAPLRANERTTHFRFWMASDTYQTVSAIQSLIFINIVQHYLTTPGLAFTFSPCADPDFWAPVFTYADLARIPEADYQVGGRGYGVYGHDWRVVPPPAWLELLAEREIAVNPEPIPPPTIEPLIVLSESEFATAVHDALRNFTLPDALNSNPLLRSRLVVEESGADASERAKIDALLDLLKTAAESLQSSPRETKFYRALYRTYFNPAPSQERAAEMLDLPFSTYRRHLKAGITRATEILWQREIRAAEG
jgi:hypothetical protein